MAKRIIALVAAAAGVRGFISPDAVLSSACNRGPVVYEFGRGKLKGVAVDSCVVPHFRVTNTVLVAANDRSAILLTSPLDHFVLQLL